MPVASLSVNSSCLFCAVMTLSQWKESKDVRRESWTSGTDPIFLFILSVLSLIHGPPCSPELGRHWS